MCMFADWALNAPSLNFHQYKIMQKESNVFIPCDLFIFKLALYLFYRKNLLKHLLYQLGLNISDDGQGGRTIHTTKIGIYRLSRNCGWKIFALFLVFICSTHTCCCFNSHILHFPTVFRSSCRKYLTTHHNQFT